MYTNFFLGSLVCVIGMIIGMIAAIACLLLKEEIKYWISIRKKKKQTDKVKPKQHKKKAPKKRKKKEKKLKDKIYSKEDSWSQFNCDMDGIDHTEYVKKNRKKQDSSYHFMKKQKKGEND